MYENSKRSAHWLDAGKAPQHFTKPELYQKKVMVTVWWSSADLIHHSFIKLGETTTAEKYCREIDEMHQKLSRKQPALVNRKGSIFLHDNARPHVSMITHQKHHTLNYEDLDHPQYSPDF